MRGRPQLQLAKVERISARAGSAIARAELEFWLLARALAPQATEELLLHKGTEHLYAPEDLKARREFLADLDRAMTEPDETTEEHAFEGHT